MSSMAYFSSFTGPTFEIVAGPKHTSFVAHASVLEKSEMLKAVVYGKWKDSIDRRIVLEDWDTASVSRLLEWFYTGDYKAPYPAVSPLPVQPEADLSEDKDDPCVFDSDDNLSAQRWSQAAPTNPSANSSSHGENQNTSSDANRPLSPVSSLCFSKSRSTHRRLTEIETFDMWSASCPHYLNTLDYRSMLLVHAKLYALASYMLLPELQAFSFHRLQVTLETITRSGSLLSNTPLILNLVTVVRYVYANTVRPWTGRSRCKN